MMKIRKPGLRNTSAISIASAEKLQIMASLHGVTMRVYLELMIEKEFERLRKAGKLPSVSPTESKEK